jgi:hypothetical protein
MANTEAEALARRTHRGEVGVRTFFDQLWLEPGRIKRSFD